MAKNQSGVMELGGNMPDGLESRLALAIGIDTQQKMAIASGSTAIDDIEDDDISQQPTLSRSRSRSRSGSPRKIIVSRGKRSPSRGRSKIARSSR